MARVTGKTKLIALKTAARPRTGDVPARMVRSIQQSLRVEGYDLSERVVREMAERVLRASSTRK